MFQARDIMELPPNDLNNNPHLRGQDARFRSGGENPRLYIEVPPMNIRLQDGVQQFDLTTDDTRGRAIAPLPWSSPQEATRDQHQLDRFYADRFGQISSSQQRAFFNSARVMVAAHHPTIDLTDPPNEAYAHVAAYDRTANNLLRHTFAVQQMRGAFGS